MENEGLLGFASPPAHRIPSLLKAWVSVVGPGLTPFPFPRRLRYRPW